MGRCMRLHDRRETNRRAFQTREARFDCSRLSALVAAGILLSVTVPCPLSAQPSAPEDFTVVVLPDTQNYSALYPDTFSLQTRWIEDNRDELNIVFVVHVGDIVDYPTALTQWENADNSMRVLDGIVPYLVVPGNHDGPPDYQYRFFNTYFGPGRFGPFDYYGGNYPPDSNQNNYAFFSAGGHEFLVLGMEYCADSFPISWADSVLGAHKNHNVIVVTHDFLENDGRRSTCGNSLWESLLKRHDNILLVLCGHLWPVARRTDLVNGKPVHQIMQNYQTNANGGDGWLRYYTFSPADNVIRAKTYSPALHQYDRTGSNEFDLELRDLSPSLTPTPTPPPRQGIDIQLNATSFLHGDPLTLAARVEIPIWKAFDAYLLADSPVGIYSMGLDGRITPGIRPLAAGVPRIDRFAAFILRRFPCVAAMNGTTWFYFVIVEAGTMPPVSRLSALSPDRTRHVITMDKEAIKVQRR